MAAHHHPHQVIDASPTDPLLPPSQHHPHQVIDDPPTDHLLPPSQTFTIDQVLEKWAGQFGPAQLLHFTLSSLAWVLHALLSFSMVFADSSPEWTCLASINSTFDQESPLPSMYHPPVASGSSSPCTSMCSMETSQRMWIGGKSQSTVSEWELVCGKEYMISLVQSVFFVGGLLGAGVYGSLSDSVLGRKGVLILSCCLSSVCSLLTALSPNYWAYFLLRGATGFNCGGMGLSCFVLATEAIGPAKRGPVAMSAFYFFSGGIMMLSTFAYFTHSWRNLYLLISVPCFLYCILVLPFLSESPRWYLTRGRSRDALDVLNQIAKRNGSSIPAGIELDTEERNLNHQEVVTNQKLDKLETALEDRLVPIHCLHSSHVQILSFLHYCPNGELDKTGTTSDVIHHMDKLQTDVQLETRPEVAILCCNEKPDAQCHMSSQHISAPGYNRIDEGNADTCKYQASTETVNHNSKQPSNATIVDIFRNRITRTRMVIMIFIWLEIAAVYYGVNLNASNTGRSVYLSIVLNAAAELPALAMTALLLNKVGRKKMLVMALVMIGGSCWMGALMGTWSWMRMASGAAAVFGLAAAYNLNYAYTAELFPTEVRNAAMGLASQAAQVGAIMSPATALLGKMHPRLPFAVFGAASLLGALLALRLPETRHTPLFDTLHGLMMHHHHQQDREQTSPLSLIWRSQIQITFWGVAKDRELVAAH